MGFDADALAGKVEQAGYIGSSCFAVARRGWLVGEWYWHGTDPAAPQPVSSITKSVASTLVGLAEADGLLDIDDRRRPTSRRGATPRRRTSRSATSSPTPPAATGTT
jgi:CubicO group peptidase (beta-lactamase class C family)